jgi:adenylate kinase
MKKAVIIYGPPGSGKGTQAELLARNFGFVHFDTGRYIEGVVHDPSLRKDRVVQRERFNFDTGKLCTPGWVLKITAEETERIAGSDMSIVFSGSPRTLFEALGDRDNRGLIEVLTRLYGKKNIFIVKLMVKGGSSMKRNSARLLCSVCGLPRLAGSHEGKCSFCGGSLRTRTLDDPKVIVVRLKEYENRTFPILDRMKRGGYKIADINGEPAPFKVHREIVRKLKLSR